MDSELALLEGAGGSGLVQLVNQGKFKEVLLGDAAQKILSDIDLEYLKVRVTVDEKDALAVAVALLHSFIQVNWTGPDVDFTLADLNGLWNDYDYQNSTAIHKLSSGGEPAYHLTRYAPLLLISQAILAELLKSDEGELPLGSAKWWQLRAAISQQHLLDDCVPLPQSILDGVNQSFSDRLPPPLQARLTLEIGIAYHMCERDREASETFLEAANMNQLKFHLTGALGKRTKFQQSDITQLVLLAQSKDSHDSHDSHENTNDADTQVKNLQLNDDTLLEQTQFSSTVDASAPLSHIDPTNQPKLSAVDQCILLAMCLNIKNTAPENGLTNSQMGAFVQRVLSNHQNWSIYTMALLLRSRLEAHRTRTVQRSTLQLQALIDQMPTSDSSNVERLKYFFAMPMPAKWELERELAQRFVAMGVVRSALEIYQKLEMWEDTIICYVSTDRQGDALETVKGLLEGNIVESQTITTRAKSTVDSKTRTRMDVMRVAKLWCLYGDLDVSNCEKHYQKALEVSKGSSSRAWRSLGGLYFAKGDYKCTIEVLRNAVAINPLFHHSWFILGCASIKVEDWDSAIESFGRCVAVEDDDAESWNNLASVYLRLGDQGVVSEPFIAERHAFSQALQSHDNKMLAFRALKQGSKFGFDNWRIWQNLMIVAIDVGQLADAARSVGRLADIRGEKICGENDDSSELDVVDKIVDAVTLAPRNEKDAIEGDATAEGARVAHNPNEGHGLLRAVDRLYEYSLLKKVSSSPRIFKSYARLCFWKGQYRNAIDMHLKAYRASVGSDDSVENDLKAFRRASEAINDLVDVLQNFGDKPADVNDPNNQEDASPDWRYQAKSILRTFLGRTRTSFEDENEYEVLKELLAEVKGA
ncbi:hypothetical protein E3P94_02722 [Wallemia ichthyophaga]|nr:hypothetical protein E3P95_02671 [Wallemia ichthyophaga]TIA99105.1 hypothetical protein E3P94_02722 [Wallemia ichthyophaga]TIB61649.1 hypothetical protein E3P78_02739 [Wallemia ichthyophaga]